MLIFVNYFKRNSFRNIACFDNSSLAWDQISIRDKKKKTLRNKRCMEYFLLGNNGFVEWMSDFNMSVVKTVTKGSKRTSPSFLRDTHTQLGKHIIWGMNFLDSVNPKQGWVLVSHGNLLFWDSQQRLYDIFIRDCATRSHVSLDLNVSCFLIPFHIINVDTIWQLLVYFFSHTHSF